MVVFKTAWFLARSCLFLLILDCLVPWVFLRRGSWPFSSLAVFDRLVPWLFSFLVVSKNDNDLNRIKKAILSLANYLYLFSVSIFDIINSPNLSAASRYIQTKQPSSIVEDILRNEVIMKFQRMWLLVVNCWDLHSFYIRVWTHSCLIASLTSRFSKSSSPSHMYSLPPLNSLPLHCLTSSPRQPKESRPWAVMCENFNWLNWSWKTDESNKTNPLPPPKIA